MNSQATIATSENKIHLTPRQLKYFGFIQQGMTKLEAAKLSGYSEETVPTHIENSPNLRKALLASMELNGLTSERLGKKIADGIEAKKTIFSSFKGKIEDEREIIDHETQHKYVKTALEIRGDLQDAGVQVNIGIIEVPGMNRTADAWNEDAKEST